MLEAFQRDPPDWVVLVHRDGSEFGARFFGVHYARSLDRWIKQHCAWSAQIGAVSFTSKFGILVGEHRARR